MSYIASDLDSDLVAQRKVPAPPASSGGALRRMKYQRQRDTRIELSIRSALHRRGFRFRVHYPVLDLRRTADIAFPRLQIAVFIDGCFWHACPEHGTWPKANAEWWRTKLEANQRRDRDTDGRLAEAGWLSVRIWEHEEPEYAAGRVQHRVLSRRDQT
jgi:DNA mismatch endonuclease, patch repair protein